MKLEISLQLSKYGPIAPVVVGPPFYPSVNPSTRVSKSSALRTYEVAKSVWCWALIDTSAAYSVISRRLTNGGIIDTKASLSYPFTVDEDRTTTHVLRRLAIPDDEYPYATAISVQVGDAVISALPVVAYDLYPLVPIGMIIGADILKIGVKYDLEVGLPRTRSPIDKLITSSRAASLE